MNCLEIQRGAKPMQNAKYSKEHGCTSGCSLRLVDASDQPIEPGQKRGMKGDSWFGHTHLADNLGTQGIHTVLQIKTGHALFPEKFLDEELAEAPGGFWITMAGKGPRGTSLLAIGYKYNSRRVLKFVATTDAGSKKAGTPYYMRFTDAYINVYVRKVQRPTIISTFFNDSNCVDSHNHVRQYELALEKKWLTQDPFFCLHTTLTGMMVADAWKLASFHKLISNANDKEGKPVISKQKFSGKLSCQLINLDVRLPSLESVMALPSSISSVGTQSSPASPETSNDGGYDCGIYTDARGVFHRPRLLPLKTKKSGKKHRRECHCQWCKEKHGLHKCTVCICYECNKPLCMPTRNNGGRNCFALHVRNCGPAKSSHKRRRLSN
jgi:hypothetical protein